MFLVLRLDQRVKQGVEVLLDAVEAGGEIVARRDAGPTNIPRRRDAGAY